MDVIVLGSGVIGLTSAWYLSQAGHRVTVVDRQSQGAKETSFANAGQISYGYSSPWAAPGIPQKALKWLFEEHAPLKIKPSIDPQLLAWMGKMLLNCQQDRYNINKARMLAIANYSRVCLADLNQQHNLQYQGRRLGTLQVFRSEKQLQAIQKDIKLLEQSGIRYQLLDVDGCIKQEPGLTLVRDKLRGGLYLPDDETGDCYLFCQQLTELAKSRGVQFLFDTQIKTLTTEGKKITAVQTDKGELKADKYVVALGSYSTALLATLGISIPVYPVKGYSLTLPIVDVELSPRSTVMDETYKVAITRFEDRIRVAGTAELAGFDPALPDARKATIAKVVTDLFPQGGDLAQAEFWTGFRPMTPDGTPIIGSTPFENLYTNTGHGTLGWTMACGSGQLLADIVSEQTCALPIHELNLSRYLIN
ncbi:MULTISPECIES: D-amino acid dehydrogenase [unclassified Vibrio]|uniref:D-amino acid dehydrogenase n=2 Tax=Vibrio TaxID=662 RepID=UPI000B8EE18E|nr:MULTISPECIES: D-amino acid dehydrogenase [unclassified Vibrio]NAW91813.1 FAD-dependent oxidoreductase [Vibrio sp. V24_P1S3T111]OXX23066.1 D-amino acid dehydrogenase small subunit [Vibrio sp. V06_P1A73T115]OXX28949.1 D-amino acid dehydrogenase small subunit [Vibrio sp. V14_P6S14T42]OXX37222.1 D-amino acid dehydrogenase small subunit [Vibrio sp. V04_P4A5T148]OXX54159.1 D-amino acid dehydrogenase small subunit [Vibrio sp. V18_P1S4T112]